jgi:protein-disulfide isomerase
MNATNNSRPCNYIYFFILSLLAITSFGFGTYYTEARMLKENGTTLAGAPTQQAQVPQEEPARAEIDPTKIPELSEADKIKGNPDAKIALIEYSDLECPFCQSFHSTAQQALDAYPNDLKWVYRHFPLTSIHPDAMPRALAAECVAEQFGAEGFWAFVDQIFSDPQMGVDSKAAAETLGYDYTAIEACVNEEKYKAQIDEQMQAAISANITGTPGAIVINTETKEAVALPGAVPLDQVKAAIEQVLN